MYIGLQLPILHYFKLSSSLFRIFLSWLSSSGLTVHIDKTPYRYCRLLGTAFSLCWAHVQNFKFESCQVQLTEQKNLKFISSKGFSCFKLSQTYPSHATADEVLGGIQHRLGRQDTWVVPDDTDAYGVTVPDAGVAATGVPATPVIHLTVSAHQEVTTNVRLACQAQHSPQSMASVSQQYLVYCFIHLVNRHVVVEPFL